MISEEKGALLESMCTGHSVSLALSVSWERQMQILYPEAQRFVGWREAGYDPKYSRAADKAVATRALTGTWPKVTPGVARLLYARLTQAIAVIGTNEVVDSNGGTRMPAGLPSYRLAGLIIAFWTYEMDLPLPEKPGAHHGTA